MSSNRIVFRLLAQACLAAVAAGLVACGSSRVVREGGGSTRASTPRPGQVATVKRGDTLYRIAVNNGISALDLATWNSISPPYTIYPGQRLRLYPGSGRRATPPVATRPGASRTPSRAGGSTPPATTPAVPSAARSTVTWRWPADGQIVARFAAGDPTRQGIGIAGNGGQPVRAAGDGVVVYSGSGLVGYGELIIVKHDERWLSAYGHNRARLVNEGERVRAGQQIAEMGRSGAARDMLHFEIRHDGKPVDPMAHLPRR
ncbi:peptidoglycan DD-metalloendopeptidase family protein [Luteimonas sp. RD2P54]|uniref:Peptidoglycan DD-metalloendopeptidase family protein n=1 Tax=Luteimonas endophytica TaxID=3042023 RepID=A0ABT6JCQ7_9GAMM|nr:peptidoglycan DD-metalloendopeptidase family protein [Luteimonas endophytica]MDH5824392.1 peptidoglycan DD-metalloendopeptidase family protein [Luteimonas endophytica]